MYNVKIISTASYLPKKVVSDEYFDKKFNLPSGTTLKKSGIKYRHYADTQTLSQMGAKVAKEAIKGANLTSPLECIIFAGGIPQQPIPCTASLIQKELGLEGVPCFDVGSTCLSFVTALDVASALIECKKYKNALLVSADIASVGIDYDDFNSAILFGDGAAAAVIAKTPQNESSKVHFYNLKTYSSGSDYARIVGGGSLLHAKNYNESNKKEYLFHMDGTKLYGLASKNMVEIYTQTISNSALKADDISLVIPHQASMMSIKLLQKKLKIPNDKIMITIERQGNIIASSIPIALDTAIRQNRIKRGDKIMLIGTSAGLSIGSMILEY